MNVVVTGAQGFVGAAVVVHLSQLGHRVIPIVRKSDGRFADAVEWDITKPYQGPALAVDCIVHAAAKVDDWSSQEAAYAVNVTGTEHVCAAFPSAQHVVYVSSASVYDPTTKVVSRTETAPAGTNLLNAYSETKFLGERVVAQSSIPVRTVLRPHIIYGPGDRTVLPRLLRARRLGRFLVLGDGKNRISLTHIDNLVGAIAQVVRKPHAGFEVYNVVDAKSGTVWEVLAALKESLGITERNLYIPKSLAHLVGSVLEKLFRLLRTGWAPLITPYLVEQMTSDHVLDCSKAVRDFDYAPGVEYSEGFTKL